MKFLQLTRNERLGLVGVILLFSVITIIKYYDSEVDFQLIPASINAVDEVEKPGLTTIQDSIEIKQQKIVLKNTDLIIKPFEKFDPNKASESYWVKLGFTPKMSSRIFRFINSGKGLNSTQDLTVIYGMESSWINSLKDSLVFPISKIRINKANKEELKELKGVGEKLATRIIKFREALGGFHSLSQIVSVYGIDSNIVNINSDVLELGGTHKKMNIVSIGLKEMVGHPYLNELQAEEIIRLRSVNSQLDSIQLRNIFTTQEWFEVKPYLQWRK